MDIKDLTSEDIAAIQKLYKDLSSVKYDDIKSMALSEFVNNSPDPTGKKDFVTQCWTSAVITHLYKIGAFNAHHKKKQ